MKRFWVGTAVLITLLAAGIAATCLVGRTHNAIADTLQAASQKAIMGSWQEAYTLYSSAKSRWERYRQGTASVTDHTPMEEIDSLFSQADVYLKLKDPGAFSACCASLGVLTRAVGEAQAVNWWSLL